MVWQQYVLLIMTSIGLLAVLASYAATPVYRRESGKLVIAVVVNVIYMVLILSIPVEVTY